MGIADRDYARPAGRGSGPGGGGLPRLARLSMTTWLIIINVAVFVIDASAPRTWWLPVHSGDVVISGKFDRDHAVFPRPPRTAPPATGAIFQVDIIDSRTQETVGWRTYSWMPPIAAIGHFSTARAFFGLEIWRFITFQFLHANITHLAFNMIGLFFFGAVVEQALRTRKRYLSFYLVCGICGSLMYLLLNLVATLVLQAGITTPDRLPGFLFANILTPLIGASAGVFGVLMAAAFFAGNATMLVMFVIPMKVRTGAYLMAALAAANLLVGGHNAGGDAAHVGGAIAGFFFVRNMHLLRDFLDILGPSRKGPPGRPRGGPKPSRHQRRLDAILDKVNHRGLDSLTRSEQDFLRRQSGPKS